MAHQNGVQNFSLVLADSGGVERGGVDRSSVQHFHVVVLPVNDAPFYSLSCSDATVCAETCGEAAETATCAVTVTVDEECADCASRGAP